MSRLSRLRAPIVIPAAAVLTLGLAAGVTVANAAPPPATAPALGLLAATPSVTIYRSAGSPARLDAGVHLVAGPDMLEIRTTRKSYHDPIVSMLVKGNTKKAIPAGLADFTGLTKFLHVTVKDTAGKVVSERDETICLNGQSAARMRPDAPQKSPFPPVCGTNPFTLGITQGLQAGWSVNPAAERWNAFPLDVPAGSYTAEFSIPQAYRAFFAIPAEHAVKTVAVTVVQPSDEAGPSAPPSTGAAAKSKAGHDHHATVGGSTAHLAGHEPLPGAPKRTVAKPNAAKPAGTKVPASGPRPDLRSLPAFGITIDDGSSGPGSEPGGEPKENLVFSANVWNAGPAPLVVDGFRRPGQPLMDAYQYFYDASGTQVGYAPTGTMEWDARQGHEHWHFTDFARYQLLGADKKAVVRSSKEAFCLVPTDAVDHTVKQANFKPYAMDLRTACGSESAAGIRETLDVGWGDTYTQWLPGQSFDLRGLPNGTYYIEVTANPGGKLFETTKSNNTALRQVIVGGTPGKRTVEVPPHELVVDPAIVLPSQR